MRPIKLVCRDPVVVLDWGGSTTWSTDCRTSRCRGANQHELTSGRVPRKKLYRVGVVVVVATFNVRDFGATGRGIDDDTQAFQNAAAMIEREHGGELLIPAGVYLVGRQDPLAGRPGLGYAYRGQPILEIANCVFPIVIRGAGEQSTVLKARPGLFYGAFDPTTGDPHANAGYYDQAPIVRFLERDYAAFPYPAMINLAHNRGPVLIEDLSLDGNQDALELGGYYSDPQYQLPATGIRAYNNDDVTIRRVTSHHQGLDGVTIGWNYGDLQGLERPDTITPHRLERVTCDTNGRNALSWVGGNGLEVRRCTFARSGLGRITSAPGAGLDIEPEDNPICRHGRFQETVFLDNAGAGMIADLNGNPNYRDVSVDVTFDHCVFYGSDRPAGHAVWPYRPGLRFNDCTIYGHVVNAFGSGNPDLATQFHHCRFEDRNPIPAGEALIETQGDNLLFDHCVIVAVRKRALWVDDGATREIFRNCVIVHRYGGLNPGDFQSLMRGSDLQDVTFLEDLLGIAPGTNPRWWINVGSLRWNNVYVAGPRVAWGAVGGRTGVI